MSPGPPQAETREIEPHVNTTTELINLAGPLMEMGGMEMLRVLLVIKKPHDQSGENSTDDCIISAIERPSVVSRCFMQEMKLCFL